MRDGCVAAAEQGLQPWALRWPCKGGHLLSSQRSRDVSATGFSIMELLGGQLGVTHTPSRADAGRLSTRVPPLATVEPTPGRGTTIGTRQWCHDGAGQGRAGGSGSPGSRLCGAQGTWALTGRGDSRVVGTRRSRSQTGSFSLCLGIWWQPATTHSSI